MNIKDLKYLIYTDLYRAYGEYKKGRILKTLFTNTGYLTCKYITMFRICNYMTRTSKTKIGKILTKLMVVKLNKMQIYYGIQIRHTTNIGKGLYIPHAGTIVVNAGTVIGDNCTILQGVTVGSNFFKERYGAPIIGNNVYIGAGAKIIGSIRIGDNVTIGANSVVTKDVPSDVVVAGIPATIISHKKSMQVNCDYLTKEEFI